MKFKVYVSYTMAGYFEVEAESLDDATEIVENNEDDSNGNNFDAYLKMGSTSMTVSRLTTI